jgi:hypothetical protein
MKNMIQIILLSFIFISVSVDAHPDGHEKPQAISKEQAITTATYRIKLMVENGTLDKSWGSAKVENTVFERRDSRFNWIVSFDVPKKTDENKKILFVYLTSTGYFISTNFTGK